MESQSQWDEHLWGGGAHQGPVVLQYQIFSQDLILHVKASKHICLINMQFSLIFNKY